jgi:hypothetical protein
MNSRLILAILALIFMLTAVTPAEAAARPTSITSVTQGKCGWQEGWIVVFDTGEKVIVGYTSLNTDDDPFVGNVSSFWRAYWSLDFPFYHSAGFTQVRSDGSQTARISFSAC